MQYYEFSALRPILSDYSRAEDIADIAEEMRDNDLIVIDGVQAGRYGPAFADNWEILMAARFNAGKPTIFLCEEGFEKLESQTWRYWIEEEEMFCWCMDQLTVKADKSLVQSIEKGEETAPQSLRERILAFFEGGKNRIRKQVYDHFAEEQAEVKTEFDALVKEGALIETKKDGLTLYRRADAKMSVRDLASQTGFSLSTISEMRNKKSLSDEEIIQRSKDRAAGE